MSKSIPVGRFRALGYTPQSWALEHVHGQEARFIAAVTSRQAGKCGVPTTRVTMADGSWKELSSIVVGDSVMAFAENGTLRAQSVIAVDDNGIQPVYKITTQRGRTTTVTGNHPFWTDRGWVRADQLQPTTLTSTAAHGPRDGDVLPWPAVWPATPSTLDERTGWLLGVLVGDGGFTGASVTVTAADAGIVNELYQFPDLFVVRRANDQYGYRLNGGVATVGRKYDLMGKSSHTKLVPKAVFAGGPEAWKGFLAGYLDADGTVQDRSVEYYSVNRGLLEGVQELLSRFGVVSSLRAKRGWYNGNVHWSWRLAIGGRDNLTALNNTITPRGDKRKRLQELAARASMKRPNGRGSRDLVISVEPVGVSPTIGLEIANDHTHITDTLMTHNSFAAAIEVDDAMSQPEDEYGLPVVGLIAPTYSHCDIVVDRYLEFLTKAFGRESFKYNQNKHLVTIEDPAAGTVGARFQWLSADDPLFAMGRTYSRLLFDESQRVSDAVFQKARPTISVRNGDIRAFGTPDINPEQSWFKGMWLAGQDGDPEYHSFSLPWTENKFMSAKDIKTAKDQSTDREFRMLYLGEWVDDEGSFFTDFDRAMFDEDPVFESGHNYIMGVDFAAVEDYNAVIVADLSTRTCVYHKRWNRTDPLLTYEQIQSIWHDWGKPLAFCDETGLGGIAMMSELKERGIRCVPIKFGANQYSNQKMEIYTRLAADLEHRRIMFPSAWDDVVRELKGFVYQRTPSGRVTASAAAGYHDDLVAALALVNEGLRARSRTTGNTTRSYLQPRSTGFSSGDKLRDLLRTL